jgi:Flp pilus assembly pilin Flp
MSIMHPPKGGYRWLALASAGRRAAAACRVLRALARHREGVTSLEYAIMGSLICAAIAASVYGFATGLGGNMAGTFGLLASKM